MCCENHDIVPDKLRSEYNRDIIFNLKFCRVCGYIDSINIETPKCVSQLKFELEVERLKK